jgi:hypothetical protein
MGMIYSLLSDCYWNSISKASMVHDAQTLIGALPYIDSASGKFSLACAISRLGMKIGEHW